MTGEGKHCTESEGAGMKEYIERAAAIEAIRKYQYPYGVEFLLSNIPAADVVEVRHAKWIKHEGYDECEACHAKAIYGSNYCPSCGALMDKEADHDKELL